VRQWLTDANRCQVEHRAARAFTRCHGVQAAIGCGVQHVRHTVSVRRMDPAQTERQMAREAEAVRQVRLTEVRELLPADRLERLHALCAQVAALASARGHGRP